MRSICCCLAAKRGFSLLELLCALAIFSMIALNIVALQQTLLQNAADDLKRSSQQLQLQAAVDRLRQILPGACDIDLEDFSRQSSKLTIQLQQKDGLQEMSFYLNKDGDLYEASKWLQWTGEKKRPGSYVTPLASQLQAFRVQCREINGTVLLNVELATQGETRSFSVLLRNTKRTNLCGLSSASRFSILQANASSTSILPNLTE